MDKVCLISRKFDKNCGRAEWIYAAKLKEELERRGMEVYIISQKNSDERSSKLKKVFHDFFVIPFKITLLRIKRIKIFHFLTENQAVCSLYVNLIGGKTITLHHDFMMMEKNRRINWIVYKLASFSKKLICNSSQTKEELISFMHPKSEIAIIYPIIFDRVNLKKNTKNLYRIGYLGGFDDRKRPKKLIEVMENLPRKFELDIWGKGKLLNDTKKEAEKKNLYNVHFKGYAPESLVPSIYNSFNFFIFPTENEGLGLPIIEAATFGNIIFILKDAKIPKEVKELCLVCNDPKEISARIIEISKNKKEYRRISSKNYNLSKEFSKEKNLNKLMKLYC